MEKATPEPDVHTEEKGLKWHGAVKETIRVPSDKAWEIAGNFCGVTKWLKTIEQCDKIEGEYQMPGCVRYLSGRTFPQPDGSKSWAKEKLLSIDENNYSMSYSIVDGNLGMPGYVSHLKFQDLKDGTSLVDWSYEVNPAENRTEEQVAALMTSFYRRSLRILEDLVSSQNSQTPNQL